MPAAGRRAFATLVCGAMLATAHGAAPLPSLAEAYHGRLKIGAAVEPRRLNGPDGVLVASQFNSLVAERVMKASRMEPHEGEFVFGPTDAIVEFAHRHGMSIRGHTLLWHRRTPEWFWTHHGQKASRDLVLERLRTYINVVVGRYKASVYAWDVVNEVIDENQPNCLRNDRWFQVVGPEYIDMAFRDAHEADPNARLFINDYSTTEPVKRACLKRLVEGLLARGVPVQGVGHQMHDSVFGPALGDVDETLTEFAQLGLENQITEFDMTLYKDHAFFLSDSRQRLLALQAERYRGLMKLFLSHPELTAVMWWGISDAHTFRNRGRNFLRTDRPLLFDTHYRPKASYWSVLDAAR